MAITFIDMGIGIVYSSGPPRPLCYFLRSLTMIISQGLPVYLLLGFYPPI